MIPALLIRMSRGPVQPTAKARTDAWLLRSSDRTSVVPGIVAAALRPLASSRTASTTRAPALANWRAVMRPSPLEAPVTTTVRPVMAGRSAAVQFCCVMADPSFALAEWLWRKLLAREPAVAGRSVLLGGGHSRQQAECGQAQGGDGDDDGQA